MANPTQQICRGRVVTKQTARQSAGVSLQTLASQEIASLKWSMVMNADGDIGDHIHLTNEASKGRAAGSLPEQRAQEATDQGQGSTASRLLMREVSHSDPTWTGNISPGHRQLVREWYRKLGFIGCSSHSGRRSFITQAARKVVWLAGHCGMFRRWLVMRALRRRAGTLKLDAEAQSKLVNIV